MSTITKVSALVLVVGLGFVGARTGATLAVSQTGATSSSSSSDPCQLGRPNCIHIGFTKAWLGGKKVDLEYSHQYFCSTPPPSGAKTNCEVGYYSYQQPPSGPVVSNIYALIPMGFTPPKSTLHCPLAGHCIDSPNTIDLSRFGGTANEPFPAHSIVLEEDESFQSTWWPLVVVGVKNLAAWNQIASEKSADAMDACEAAGNCTSEQPTNAYIFFQVLGPGMSPAGPA
ncbi:MAG: hypothetical protein ACJ735_03060 [Actinomycetes bacterium]